MVQQNTYVLHISLKRIECTLKYAYNRIILGKALPAIGREGPYECERSRLPHFLDNRLTDDGEVVSLTHLPLFIPQEDSWYSFLLEVESAPGP
jgi:hypothetical protein